MHKKLNYPIAKRPEEADAIAWVFSSKHSFQKEYIKLPIMKSDEIRARVLYTALCHTDIMMGRGKKEKLEYPICPGHEIVAKVIMKGSAVTHLEVGDVVGIAPFIVSCGQCKFCKDEWNHACENMPFSERFIYYNRFGGFATHVQQPAKYCVRIPKAFDIKKVAPLLCSGVTAFTPIFTHVTKEDKVIIMGCGGLGHLAVQFAKKMAGEVTVVTHTKDKIDDIKKLGADRVLLSEDFYNNISDLEYDVMINTLPVWPKRDQVKKWIDCLNYYGKLIVLGVTPDSQKMELDASWLTIKCISVIASLAGGKRQTDLMLKFVEDNNIESWCEYYDFDDFDKALDRLENESPRFKVVVEAENAAIELETSHE